MQMATSWPRNAATRQTLYDLHSLYMRNPSNQAGWTEVGPTPLATLGGASSSIAPFP